MKGYNTTFSYNLLKSIKTVSQPVKDAKINEGPGWKQIILADAEMIGAPAMVACRWHFEAGATGPGLEHNDSDQRLYVIQGSSQAVVNGETLPLEPESVLWLEPGERYHFVAGEAGLEILQGYAPA